MDLGDLFGGAAYSGGITKKDIFKSLIKAYNSEKAKAADCKGGSTDEYVHSSIASALLSMASDFYDPSFNE